MIGATGQLGGSVVRACLQSGWKVRGLTRNVDSDPAKRLISKDAEIVSANSDDKMSLVKAFEVRYE